MITKLLENKTKKSNIVSLCLPTDKIYMENKIDKNYKKKYKNKLVIGVFNSS